MSDLGLLIQNLNDENDELKAGAIISSRSTSCCISQIQDYNHQNTTGTSKVQILVIANVKYYLYNIIFIFLIEN